MSALVLLALAIAFARVPHGLVLAAAILVAALAGTTLPDLDQILPLLHHRSAWTHSIAPVGLALAWHRSRPIAAGLAIGIALHLSADCFPRAMIGYATVKVPYWGSLGAESYLWLAINAGLAIALAGALTPARLPDPGPRWAVLIGALLLAPWYLARVDGGWRALAVLVLIAAIAWRSARVSVPIRD